MPNRKVYVLILVFVSLLIGGLVYFISSMQTPVYQSTTKFLVEFDSTEDVSAYESLKLSDYGARVVTELINSSTFLEKVLEKSEVIYSREELEGKYADKIFANVIEDTQIVKVTVKDSSSSRATKIANNVIDIVKSEIDVLFKNDLSSQYSSTTIRAIEQPTSPYKPISPQPFRYGLIAAAAIMLLGIFITSFNEI
jgi:capsular polysaccharide biosynthesis protein